MDLDLRVVFVLSPLVLALGWAGFNIAQAAISQFQGFWEKES
ncbi:MAG: photosystem II protein Y [Coleofasciculaceae cyanobacterium RL_1_1]|jgi:photosystem II PsbY protein|nr:photosystem II protein Y [Coleofasciculaceae cyanobacterium RL_1_1]